MSMDKVGDEAEKSWEFTYSKMSPVTWVWRDNRCKHSSFLWCFRTWIRAMKLRKLFQWRWVDPQQFVAWEVQNLSKKVCITPRLKLRALVLPVNMDFLKIWSLKLKIDGAKEIFSTDSQVVLAHIRSNSKRFKLFVANRVHQIQESTSVNQWCYVWGKQNLLMMLLEGLM